MTSRPSAICIASKSHARGQPWKACLSGHVDQRRLALCGTALGRAQVSTIRCRLLKIGAIVKVSVRRVYLSLSSVFPLQ